MRKDFYCGRHPGRGTGEERTSEVFSTTLHGVSVSSLPNPSILISGTGPFLIRRTTTVRNGTGIIRPFAFAVKPAFPDTMETDSESRYERGTD